MPDNNGWVEIGSGEMSVGGEPVGLGRAFIAPVGTPLPPPPATYKFSGVYLPCEECHYPALVQINGVAQVPPGGATLQWSGGQMKTRRFIPHEEGCAEAVAHPDDREKGRVYLPAHVIGNLDPDLPEHITAAMDAITATLKGELP